MNFLIFHKQVHHKVVQPRIPEKRQRQVGYNCIEMFFLMSTLAQYQLQFENYLLPTTRKGNVFTGVCLFTICLMTTRSLLILVTEWSVCILLQCLLVGIICNFLILLTLISDSIVQTDIESVTLSQ